MRPSYFNRKMSILRRTFGYTLVAALLLATAQRLPAPISEIESPTPTPEQSIKPKPKRAPKPKPKPEARASATSSVRQQAAKQNRFAGTWVGTMPEVPWGNVATELVVDQTETTMLWQEGATRKGLEKTQLNGNTMEATFFVGGFYERWSLTPKPDGKTASVRLTAYLNDQTAVFHRVAE